VTTRLGLRLFRRRLKDATMEAERTRYQRDLNDWCDYWGKRNVPHHQLEFTAWVHRYQGEVKFGQSCRYHAGILFMDALAVDPQARLEPIAEQPSHFSRALTSLQ
jgi:hypothetical protein